jgi:hypothetical protein
VHNQSHTLLSDSDIWWLVLWFSTGVQFTIMLTYLTLLPQRVAATMNYCASLLWYINGMCCNFFIRRFFSTLSLLFIKWTSAYRCKIK